jgi:hypothetical protein
MLAIAAGSKEKCDEMYHRLSGLGVTCDGEPRQRVPVVFMVRTFVILTVIK